MKTYRSRIGWEIWGPAILLFIFIIYVSHAMWQVAACILLVALFFACMVLGTTYAVGKDTLVVKCWPVVNMEIAINSIHRIRDTWSPLSSPAASYFGRIEVHYGRGRTCIISPKDKKAFIEHLLSKNKSILTFEVK